MSKFRPRHLAGVVLLGLTVLFGLCTAMAQALGPAHPEGIGDARATAADNARDRYIVTVRDQRDPASVAMHSARQRPAFVYHGALNGFAAHLTNAQVGQLRKDPNVERIEHDAVVHASTTQVMDPAGDPWGLDRIDQHTLPASETYSYHHRGGGVNAYVIDTGLAATHPEFEGRARNVFDAFGGNGTDCNGHGTHVAGTIGGRTYGVAKRVNLRGVRVLNCDGSGTLAGVIAGIDWVAAHHSTRAVANLSLGGGFSPSLNAAIEDLVASRTFVAVAAGNDSADACDTSPASAPDAYTVAASDRIDEHAWFSNSGRCVDGYAPGVDIVSSVPGGIARFSGTSMASPHVAGIAALLKSYANSSAAAITDWIDRSATPNILSGVPAGTPNRLVYKAAL